MTSFAWATRARAPAGSSIATWARANARRSWTAPAGAAAVRSGRRPVARASSRRAPAMSPRWIISLMRTARDGTLDRYPSICRSRVDRVALGDESSGGIPGTLFGRHESAVSEHAVPDRDVARRSGRDDRVGQGCVCARQIADREAREGQLPQREVPPRPSSPSSSTARVAFASASSAPRRTMPARSIARPASNEAVPSGGRPSNAPRSATSAKRIVAATSPAAISSQAASTASHGRASRASDANTPGPCSDRRTVAGPVESDEAVADQRGDEVGVACREGVVDGALDGVVRRYHAAARRWRVVTRSGSRIASSRWRKSRRSVW